jgi:hypothetical protein
MGVNPPVSVKCLGARRCAIDPVTLAGTAVTFLASYLVKGSEKAAEEAGRRLPDLPGKIWHAIIASFRGKPAAEEAIKDFIAQPEDEDNWAAFRKELRKALEAEPTFAQELGALLDNVRRQGDDSIIVTGSGAAATRGSIAAGAGGVAVGGDVQGGITLGGSEQKEQQR